LRFILPRISLKAIKGVTFVYLPGKKNVVADALSRLDIDELNIPPEDVQCTLP
jgi:hypothetical protein